MTNQRGSRETVLLVHGIWMHGIELRFLGKKLAEDGYHVEYFKYFSLFRSPEQSVEKLVRRLLSIKSKRLHIVAHSLGGLIAMRAVRRCQGLPDGRIVLLGTPAQGSAAARRLQRLHVGWLLGQNSGLLTQRAADWDQKQQLATIAGTLNIGLGLLLGGIDSPGDGTVSEAETQLAGETDHASVHGSHFGMLFQQDVVELVKQFLRYGVFKRL